MTNTLVPSKWSHLSATPGGYVYDPELGQVVGRLKTDGTEDHRFTADGETSFINTLFKAFRYPHKDPIGFIESVDSGYACQGFGVILSEWTTLTGPEWAMTFAELKDIYPKGVAELLWEVSKDSQAERLAKLSTIARLYPEEAKRQNIDLSPYHKWVEERKAEAEKRTAEKQMELIEKAVEQAIKHFCDDRSQWPREIRRKFPETITADEAIYGWRKGFKPKPLEWHGYFQQLCERDGRDFKEELWILVDDLFQLDLEKLKMRRKRLQLERRKQRRLGRAHDDRLLLQSLLKAPWTTESDEEAYQTYLADPRHRPRFQKQPHPSKDKCFQLVEVHPEYVRPIRREKLGWESYIAEREAEWEVKYPRAQKSNDSETLTIDKNPDET